MIARADVKPTFGNIFVVVIALGTVQILLNFFLGIARQKKRSRFLSAYIQQRGYYFVNPDLHLLLAKPAGQVMTIMNSKSIKRETDGITGIREFRERSKGIGFHFDFFGRQMTIFDYAYSAGTGSQASIISLRVAKLHVEGLPEFRLQRETIVEKILDAAGISKKIVFSDRPEFSRTYHLSARSESEIRSFLTDQKIAYLENNPIQGEIVTNSEYIVYCETGKFSDESSYDVFISRAKSAFDSLLKQV